MGLKAGGKVETHSLPHPPSSGSNSSVKTSLGSGKVTGCDHVVQAGGTISWDASPGPGPFPPPNHQAPPTAQPTLPSLPCCWLPRLRVHHIITIQILRPHMASSFVVELRAAVGKVESHSLPPPFQQLHGSSPPQGPVGSLIRVDVRAGGRYVGMRSLAETPSTPQITRHHHPPNWPSLRCRVAVSHV